MTQPSKKPKKPRSKKINVSVRSQWESILKSVTKEEVPVELLESLTVNLTDGTKVNVNVKEMLEGGKRPKDVERMINERLDALDNVIIDVDFFICIDSVVKAVQPETDKILKDI
jgi:hypothetical protein